MRKLILAIAGIALILASVFFAKNLIDNKNKVRPVPQKVVKSVFVETVTNTTVPIIIPSNGNLTAKRRLELYSEVQGIFNPSGKLFRPGQKYKKGETFIDINSDEYTASVQSAKSNLYNSIASIMPDLRLDFPEIYKKWQNYLTNFDMDASTPKLPKMTSEKENFFIIGRGIVSNYYNVKNLEQRLSKYYITAPFDGILTEALVTEGSLIRNGQKLGEFIDPTIYEMEVAISKSFANLLKIGEDVRLNNLEGTESYQGKVSRINGSIDPTTQTIRAFIEVKDKNLKEGMYLEARLDARKEKNAIEIDRNLLLDTNEIYIVKDGSLKAIPVKPVFFSDTKVVLKGVPDGSVILSKPVPGAYQGMLVKVYNDTAAKTKQ